MRWIICLLAAAVSPLPAAEDEGFVALFNGRDLSGWVNANCAPETWSVRDDVIQCTGRPTGAMRTEKQYENFILEVEWRHLTSGGNSGIFLWGTPLPAPGVPFLRGIEVQVLDHGYDAQGKNQWFTTHGDVFPIHGATMKPFGRHNGMRSFPSEERSKPSPEWNHYRIVCTNGVLRLSVNGKEVSGGENCNYRKGYLALESEGAPVEFRNLRIKELPSSGAPPEETAPLDQGWRSLFTGLDLRGWKTNHATASRWGVSGERLSLKAGDPSPAGILWTEATFGDAEFVLDYRPDKSAAGMPEPAICLRGNEQPAARVVLAQAEPGKYQRYIVTIRGKEIILNRNGEELARTTVTANAPAQGPLGLYPAGNAAEFMNLFVRNLQN